MGQNCSNRQNAESNISKFRNIWGGTYFELETRIPEVHFLIETIFLGETLIFNFLWIFFGQNSCKQSFHCSIPDFVQKWEADNTELPRMKLFWKIWNFQDIFLKVKKKNGISEAFSQKWEKMMEFPILFQKSSKILSIFWISHGISEALFLQNKGEGRGDTENFWNDPW